MSKVTIELKIKETDKAYALQILDETKEYAKLLNDDIQFIDVPPARGFVEIMGIVSSAVSLYKVLIFVKDKLSGSSNKEQSSDVVPIAIIKNSKNQEITLLDASIESIKKILEE